MTSKGKTVTIATRQKISVNKQKDRTKILKSIMEYVSKLIDPEQEDLIPSIVSASLYAGISKKVLLTWELTTAEDSEVRQYLDFIRDLEEKYLRDNSLTGKISSKPAMLFLKAEHGMQEKPQQLTQNNTFNVSPEIMAEAIELSRKPQTKKS